MNHIDQAAVSNGHTVLIDTWWNVNLKREDNALLLSSVLIDTWWNVNRIKSLISESIEEF